jgi:hypothetical protein
MGDEETLQYIEGEDCVGKTDDETYIDSSRLLFLRTSSSPSDVTKTNASKCILFFFLSKN